MREGRGWERVLGSTDAVVDLEVVIGREDDEEEEDEEEEEEKERLPLYTAADESAVRSPGYEELYA